MNTDGNGLKHYELTKRIIGVFYEVYNELGSGFLEAVYVEALTLAFRSAGLLVYREWPLEVRFRGHVIGRFRADLVIDGRVLVEVKAVPKLQAPQQAQLLNYLRATVLEVGLLLNFGSRPQFRRLRLDNTFKIRQRQHRSSLERGA